MRRLNQALSISSTWPCWLFPFCENEAKSKWGYSFMKVTNQHHCDVIAAKFSRLSVSDVLHGKRFQERSRWSPRAPARVSEGSNKTLYSQNWRGRLRARLWKQRVQHSRFPEANTPFPLSPGWHWPDLVSRVSSVTLDMLLSLSLWQSVDNAVTHTSSQEDHLGSCLTLLARKLCCQDMR